MASQEIETLMQALARLPGLGPRSARRAVLWLVKRRETALAGLVEALAQVRDRLVECHTCGNVDTTDPCAICADPRRDHRLVCVVEHVPDLVALERSGAWRGIYHVLHGRLSPLQGVGPADLNFGPLLERLRSGEIDELIFALANDVEGEATCHYLIEQLPADRPVRTSRIGFGLPSGGGVLYADAVTLKSALDSRRAYS